MGVYRSDQAQLTFGYEPTPGAYVEGNSLGGTGYLNAPNSLLNGAITAGSWTIDVDTLAGTGYVQATYEAWLNLQVRIGDNGAVNTEVRRIEHIVPGAVDSGTGVQTFTFYLNAPLALAHPNNTKVTGIQALTANSDDIYINNIPGVYETVDVPDPEMAIEARYFLGTASRRNFFSAYKGQQSYTGSVPGFVLLDAKPLRFPIGKVVTKSPNKDADNYAKDVKLGADVSKGTIWIPVLRVGGNTSDNQVMAAGEIICFDRIDNTADPVRTDKAETRKIVTGNTATDSLSYVRIDYPLQYDHSINGIIGKYQSTAVWEHHIFETIDLDTVTWHLHMKESSETATLDFDRRYFGGKIDSATIAADEGGMLTMSWDGVNFLGMVHNQQFHSATGSTVGTSELPFYGLMQKIDASEIVFPNTEPYYFSQGSVKLFNTNTEIASIRSFSLSISNNSEPRYYIQRRHGRGRGPVEVREQQREYSLAVTLALPDATASDSTTGNLFKELILEGDYGTGMQGFNVTLRFERGVDDYIEFIIPDDGTSNVGGNTQGAFIRTAPHAISGENPLQVDADILVRNMKIVVRDPNNSTGYYLP